MRTWSYPAACLTSFFSFYIINFPEILCRTSPTLIWHTPVILSSGFNRLAVNTSKLLSAPKFKRCMFVLHKLFTKFAMDIRRYKELEAK